MTDFSSKLVVYLNINQYNPSTTEPMLAHYIQSLDYPLVNNASQYSVAVMKAKFDTSLLVPSPDPAPPINPAKRIDKIIIQSSSLSVIGSVYANNLQNQTIYWYTLLN